MCPHCDSELRPYDRHGVEIDSCPNCRGVWLDRGELDKIIDRAGRYERDDDDDDRRRPYRDDQRPGYPPHKKKSFWHELFD
jgi:Zn-finger nucleic acid-binding protein